MNFKDLLTKLHTLEENSKVEECGMPIIGGPMEQQKQQDNVTMNVSMNGSGEGGIRDLMNILRTIEKSEDKSVIAIGQPHDVDHGHEEPLMGDDDMEEEYGNSAEGGSGQHTYGVDAVTATGDDMNSKGKLSPLFRMPGSNPMRSPMEEGIVERLSNLYNEVKTRDIVKENVTLDENGQTLRHIIHTYQRDVKDFTETGELSNDLYEALYDYYFDDMPYGTKKARTGDPFEWISNRFAEDLGIDEAVAQPLPADPQQGGMGAGD